jgi:lipid A 3-O-deacylase
MDRTVETCRTVVVLAVLTTSHAAVGGETDHGQALRFGVGWFDAVRGRRPAAQASLAYQREIAGPLHGLAVGLATSDGAAFVGAGIALEIRVGWHLMLTPEFAPGYYKRGRGRALGFPLEFRSRLEVAWAFGGGSRLGLAVSHISNGSLGSRNPGEESLAVVSEIPLGRCSHPLGDGPISPGSRRRPSRSGPAP